MRGISSLLQLLAAILIMFMATPNTCADVVFQSAELTASTVGYIGDGQWEKGDSLTSAPPDRVMSFLVEGSLFSPDSHGYTQAFMGLDTYSDWVNFYFLEVTDVNPFMPDLSAGGTTICEWEVRLMLNERQRFEFGVETLLGFGRSPSTSDDPTDLWEYSETFTLLDARRRAVFDAHRESSDREVHLRSGILGPGEYVLQVRSDIGFALRPPLTDAGVHSNFGGELHFSPVPEPSTAGLLCLSAVLAGVFVHKQGPSTRQFE